MLFNNNLNYHIKFLFMILFFIFFQINIFSFTPSVINCYDKVTGNIDYLTEQSCSDDGNYVLDQLPNQAVCEIGTFNYTSVGNLDTIYNESTLKSDSVSITQYAGDGQFYDIVNDVGCILHEKTDEHQDITISLETIQAIIDGDTGDGEDTTDDSNLGNEENSSGTDRDDNPFSCHNRIGPFGIFSSKSYCEADSDCLFNPHGRNILKEEVENFAEHSLCVNKSYIKQCFNYKTENNCNNNRADLEVECKWVESEKYSLNLFNFKSGICIEKDENNFEIQKDLKRDKMNDRGNLIKNPSFEDISSDYVNYISDENVAYDLYNYYILDNSNSYKYEIELNDIHIEDFIGAEEYYKFLFFVKSKNVFKLDYSIIFL